MVVTGSAAYPESNWDRTRGNRMGIWSTNSLERFNAEINRRTNVVGIFPNDIAALRLITAVVLEQHDEWSVS